MTKSYEPNDPRHSSWVQVVPDGDFPIQNLPLGIFVARGKDARPAVRIGDSAVDLLELSALGYLKGLPIPDCGVLNPLLARGRDVGRALRMNLSWLLNAENPELRDNARHVARVLLPLSEVELKLPVAVGDYVDFYSSLEHATNVGKMFRDPQNPLLPNWRHLPVGYHGRSGTIVVAGENVRRPCGQASSDMTTPQFGPSRRLDIELETAFVIGRGSEMGHPIPIAEAEEHIAGIVLLNDWSARDIQRWEYQPLGPFLGKSFATSITPWVVSMDALEPFRVPGPVQEPAPLEYLRGGAAGSFDIRLAAYLRPANQKRGERICNTNFKHLYWSMAQQLAHLTSNGGNVRTGDLCGSGTISGAEPGSFGSLLELTWNGTTPLRFASGVERTFLEDGDTVILKGWCEGSHRIGFGELIAEVLPA